MKSLWLVGVLGILSLSSCGDSEQTACTPGESVACTGPGACAGFQVCSADGSAFATCDCSGATTTTGSSAMTSTGAGQGGDMTTTSGSTSSSGGGGSGTGGGTFSPTDLPGLALWMHTGAGLIFDPQNPGNIIRWDDQSPHGHQAVSTASPAFAPTTDPSAVNGYDAVRCFGNATSFTINDDPSLQWGTGGFLIAGIIRPGPSPTTAFNLTRFLAKEGLTTFELTQPSMDTLKLAIGAQVVTTGFTAFPNDYRLVMARGMDLELSIDDSLSTGPTATGNIDNVGSGVIFCGGGNTDIAIAEFIAVKGAVSDPEAEQVRAYLADKYEL